MGPSVTFGTKRDQVLFGIISQLAARLNVVRLEVSEASAVLTTPPIPLEHLKAQPFVRSGIKP